MPFTETLYEALPVEEQALLKEAAAVAENAYNPYSHFRVGAAVLTTSGKVYAGTNMENASYGLTICAEPAAIMAAFSAGDKNILTIAITGGDDHFPDSREPITPCGRCRQIIFETAQQANQSIRVICANKSNTHVVCCNIEDLLPFPFIKDKYKDNL